jgi:ferredoxin
MSDVFKQLACHLDQLPGGYPATENGLELRILKRLFSPEEAQIALALSLKPEPADVIAERIDTDAAQLEPVLRKMSHKGLIFHRRKHDRSFFMAAQFVIGIWEYHVNSLDEGLIEDFNAYVPYLAEQWKGQRTKQLRVVPISQSLSADMQVMAYQTAEQIITAQSKIVVAPCICRKEQKMIGKGCDNPQEVCLIFGSGAYYYEENGLGRQITKQEALDILHKGAEAGLVLQPGNAQKAINICMCCGCCCQILKNIKQFDIPALAVNSSYYAQVDASECVTCGICETRCHMEAIEVDDTATIDLNRCIGCGVCIPTCEVGALHLVAKPEQEQWVPPKTTFEAYFAIAKERGLL